MKYLAEGYYYRVYELDDTRVFKKFQSYWFSFLKIYALNRKSGTSFIDSILDAHRSRIAEARALRSMKEKLRFIPPFLFASPSFTLGSLNYSQDKVTILADFLENHDLEHNKKIIDQYIEFQKILWSYGLHDKTYKLRQNYGVDRNNVVVCIDFGEFTSVKGKVLESILQKKWLSRGSYKRWNDEPVKEYYTHCMNLAMTEENLDTHWSHS